MIRSKNSDGTLTHLDDEGNARMVNIGGKPNSRRRAVARGIVRMQPSTLALLRDRERTPKGDVLGTARLAGILAAKRTGELIPLCHHVSITGCDLQFSFSADDEVVIEAAVESEGRTGVEMEALTAVSIAGLTVYDMLKAVDRSITLTAIQLTHKSGGQTGEYSP